LVRHTVPLVCKAWDELYRSQGASPLHEMLKVNFEEEIENTAARDGGTRCDLLTLPAFVGELESLELLDLRENDPQICATLDFLIKGCPRLGDVRLPKETDRHVGIGNRWRASKSLKRSCSRKTRTP
jgi:hypothetical protein